MDSKVLVSVTLTQAGSYILQGSVSVETQDETQPVAVICYVAVPGATYSTTSYNVELWGKLGYTVNAVIPATGQATSVSAGATAQLACWKQGTTSAWALTGELTAIRVGTIH